MCRGNRMVPKKLYCVVHVHAHDSGEDDILAMSSRQHGTKQ
jgi:hypothetical protein